MKPEWLTLRKEFSHFFVFVFFLLNFGCGGGSNNLQIRGTCLGQLEQVSIHWIASTISIYKKDIVIVTCWKI